MHKITKGLKKKKKGKKSKRKEEELFKPEELEEYRKEHQGASAENSSSAEKNEEWKKFLALTSGVDDVLKKTQGDLDRIKSTSFFQRKPVASELKNRQQPEQSKVEEEAVQEEIPEQLGIVEVSESESEEEEDDSIFNTEYIDAIATGEVKLAYIPESPTEKLGDDPFDTSIADRAILGPEFERKGKKLVPLGAAVEVLTGRVQLPTCATKVPRRQVLKQRDLLLGSFDDNLNFTAGNNDQPEEIKKTLLDEDTIPLVGEPIVDFIKSSGPIVKEEVNAGNVDNSILSEFDIIANKADDPDDIEFESLAVESLSKSTVQVLQAIPIKNTSEADSNIKWNAFGEQEICEVIDDPFDTSFTEKIVPGKKELQIIEKEILSDNFKPQVNNKICFQISDISEERNDVVIDDRIPESELVLIKPIHRDLLGGSNTDLSNLSDPPLQLSGDPFTSTSNLDNNTLNYFDDDDFDPRANEQKPKERTLSRPDVLNVSGTKSVSFDISSPTEANFLSAEASTKVTKPLTPFYIRKNSVPALPLEEDIAEDPFDTSFASNIVPGKAELKVIESELFDPIIEKQLSLIDNSFDPRDERQAEFDKVVGIIKDISNTKVPDKPVDLLSIDNDISTKVLTPGSNTINFQELSYCDPFDTSSIATNILPGKTELKLLETELINDSLATLQSQLDQPIQNLLENHDNIISDTPLCPSGISVESNRRIEEDFDPFDTSFANSIQPGKAELKLLESEFIS